MKKRSACGTLAPSAVALATFSNRASAHQWHVVPFLLYRGLRSNFLYSKKAFRLRNARAVLALSVLASLGHLSQRERQALSALATLGHLSQRERQALGSPLGSPFLALPPWLSPLGELSPKVTERALALPRGAISYIVKKSPGFPRIFC